MIATLLAIVIVLLIIELARPKKDRLARKAIQELAAEMNREVRFYDAIQEILVRVKDYNKEREGCPVSEQLQSISNIVSKHDQSFNALQKHFNFKIVRETTPMVPAKTEVKVVEEKKEVRIKVKAAKKSNKRRK